MNGAPLALGFAALAALASAAQRGSAARACPSDALVFYHGAQRWEGAPTVVAHRKGHAEHGPGIYLTTSWERANDYAKGGGSVYRVKLEPGTRWLQDARIEADVMRAFVRGLARLKGRKEILETLDRMEQRLGPNLQAEFLVNAFVNRDAASGQHGPALAAFLTEHGVDASHVRVHAGEDWVVVFNPQIVCAVERLAAKQVRAPGFAFDLPRVRGAKNQGAPMDMKTLGRKVKAWCKTNASYGLLDGDPETTGSSWDQGGCAVLALALKQIDPSLSLMVLIRSDRPRQAQHYAVARRGARGALTLVDCNGAKAEVDFLRYWRDWILAEEPRALYRPESFSVEPVSASEITDDPDIPAPPALVRRVVQALQVYLESS